MPAITALLHTENDARRLGRALETLRACDEIVIVDHESRDATARIAREYGARVITAELIKTPELYLKLAAHPWILCLNPCESLTEGLEATLLEWRWTESTQSQAFSVRLREETPRGWAETSEWQTRLVPRHWSRFEGRLPAHDPSAVELEGELLRFSFP